MTPAASDRAARRAVNSLHELIASGEKFGTIYADPPWRYDKNVGRGAAARHYDGTMTVRVLMIAPPLRSPGREAP